MQLIAQAGDLGPKWFHVALRAMVLLAQSDSMLSSNQIGEKLGAESTFLRKILGSLAKKHLVITYAGKYGGYTLGRPADKISVGDVYRALVTSGENPYTSVPFTGSEQVISLIVSKADEQFQKVLDKYTIEDLIKYSKLMQYEF